MKHGLMGGFLAIGVLAGCSMPAAQVSMVPGTILSVEESAQLREMQLDGHFGAFARSPNGAWAWTAGYNAMSAARADALSMCNGDDLSGSGCTVVFELLPVGAAPMVGDKTLTIDAADELAQHMPRRGASAFAIAADGTHGHGWGYGTVAQAETRALTECNSRNIAREAERQGLPTYPCEVVWTKPAPAN